MPSESPYRSSLRPEDFAPQKGFNISIISILVFLVGVGVHLKKFGGLERINYGGAIMGMVIGGYLAVFLLATVISFFAFAGTRSRVVSALFFCLSVPALIYADMQVNKLADAKILPQGAQVKAAAASPAPGASPAESVAPAATAAPAAPGIPGNPTYTGVQRQGFISQANNAFVADRDAKIKAFTDAFTALQTAGGVSPAGLTSKDAIAARRKLVADLNIANDGYIDFVTHQEETYRAELAKTPLVQNDINNTVSQFQANNPHTADKLAVRQTEKELLKANDDVLEMMDATWGKWKLAGSRAVFSKKSDTDEYGRMLQRFNAAATAQAAAQTKLTAAQGTAAPEETPDAAVAAAVDAKAAASTPAAPVATPAASASHAGAPKPTP